MNKSIKIFVVYHKPGYLLKDDIYFPIHAGRAVAATASKDGINDSADLQWLLKNTIGDDDGDNISRKNRNYCECTALYWAWKNYDKIGNPDYIGFMQYRRHFILNEKAFADKSLDEYEKAYSTIRINYPNKDYLRFLGIDRDHICRLLDDCGGVFSSPCKLDIVGEKSQRDDYINKIPGTNAADFDVMIETAAKLHPQMAEYIRSRANQPLKSCFQMFILPKDVFFEYMNFLFSVLFECEKKIDLSSYSVNGKRTIGYFGELLYDYFMNFNKERFTLKDAMVCLVVNDVSEDEINNYNSLELIPLYLFNKLKYLMFKKKSHYDNYRKYKMIIKARSGKFLR